MTKVMGLPIGPKVCTKECKKRTAMVHQMRLYFIVTHCIIAFNVT